MLPTNDPAFHHVRRNSPIRFQQHRNNRNQQQNNVVKSGNSTDNGNNNNNNDDIDIDYSSSASCCSSSSSIDENNDDNNNNKQENTVSNNKDDGLINNADEDDDINNHHHKANALFPPLEPPTSWKMYSALRKTFLLSRFQTAEQFEEFDVDDDSTSLYNLLMNDDEQEQQGTTTATTTTTSPPSSSSPSPSPPTTSHGDLSKILVTPNKRKSIQSLVDRIKNEKDEAKKDFLINLPLPPVSTIFNKIIPFLRVSFSYFSPQASGCWMEPAEDLFSSTEKLMNYIDLKLAKEFDDENNNEDSNNSQTIIPDSAEEAALLPQNFSYHEGATLLPLAVLTGDLELLTFCLDSGYCNPNDVRFMSHYEAVNQVSNIYMYHERMMMAKKQQQQKQQKETSGEKSNADDKKNNKKTKGSSNNDDNKNAPPSSPSLPPQIQLENIVICDTNGSTYSSMAAQRTYQRHGLSPFFLACLCEQIECMDLLYKKGASLHIVDRWGRTPLHAASANGSKNVVDWLLAHGAPRLVTDRDNLRPGQYPFVRGSVSSSTSKTITIPPRDPRFHHLLMRPNFGSSSSNQQQQQQNDKEQSQQQKTHQPLPCPCGSGRVIGSCGCVDDTHEKWYLDRVGSSWISGDIRNAISEVQSSVLSLMAPDFIFGEYYQNQKQKQQTQENKNDTNLKNGSEETNNNEKKVSSNTNNNGEKKTSSSSSKKKPVDKNNTNSTSMHDVD